MYYGGWVGTVKEEKRSFIAFASSPDNLGRYCNAEDVVSAPPDPAALEKIKAKQNFDSGYDFSIVEELVYGADVEPGPQNIGNCVGYSHCMLLAAKMAHEIFVELQPEQPIAHNSPVPYIPYSYGAGRVYVGGNRLRGDGSIGSWQIQASMEHGFLPCDAEGVSGDVPQGSSSTGRNFGSSKRTLDEYRPQAIKFDLMDSTIVESIDEVKRFLTEVYSPLQILSNWGFAPKSYDSNRKIWIYGPSGSWAHSMQLLGWLNIKGEEFIHVRNQWGRDAHKDCTPTIPLGGYLITPETLSRWIKDAYVATIGEIKGKARESIIRRFPF